MSCFCFPLGSLESSILVGRSSLLPSTLSPGCLTVVAEGNAWYFSWRLQSVKEQSVSVGKLLDQVNTSDEHLEANLCTMLQSVRGTKQYWFFRHSELKCMIREWGSLTLFLTFSCAEYESSDITEILRMVPPGYQFQFPGNFH